MSDAMRSPVFRGYLVVLVGLLVVAGALLVLLRFVLKKNVDHAWKAYRGWLVMIPILRDRAKGQLQLIALSVVGFMYVGWMFLHLAYLANAKNAYGYLLFLLFAVPLNDIAAFTFGRTFGKRQLRENISPNKTWAGAISALAVSMLLPWLVRFSFPEFGTLQLILTRLIVGIGGQLGDLTISVIKRDIGIKDMGALIEGHGGVLDRVDSLIYVAPLFFHMARYFYGL